MSYFLVRLFQGFSSVSLAEDVQTLAPAEWANAPGRKGVEKAIARSHLTMYVEVSLPTRLSFAVDTADPMVQDGLWVRMEEAGDAEDSP